MLRQLVMLGLTLLAITACSSGREPAPPCPELPDPGIVEPLRVDGKRLPPLPQRTSGQALRALRGDPVSEFVPEFDLHHEVYLSQMGVWDEDESSIEITSSGSAAPPPRSAAPPFEPEAEVNHGVMEREHHKAPWWSPLLWASLGFATSVGLYWLRTGKILFLE